MEKIIENKNYIYIGIISVLAIVLILVINKTTKLDNDTSNKNVVVNNPSNFFTIENCVNKFINVIYKKETDNILTLLNDEYINENTK